jgi:hypothetical protein
MDRDLLSKSANAMGLRHSIAIRARPSRVITVMNFRLCPPLVARLRQGGDGGVNITAKRRMRSVMFTPSPRGTVTVRPADLTGQLQSR